MIQGLYFSPNDKDTNAVFIKYPWNNLHEIYLIFKIPRCFSYLDLGYVPQKSKEKASHKPYVYSTLELISKWLHG